jgi:hypothetical protein
MNYPPSPRHCGAPLPGPPRAPKSSSAATKTLRSFGQIVTSRSAIVIPACGAQPQAAARPRSCASAPSMPRSTVARLSASPTSKPPTQYGPTATEAPSASSAWPPETPSPTAFARPSKPPPTVSQGIRSAVSSMATSIASASMLRSNNWPPSAHSPLTQSKPAVEALPSGWPSNTSKPRIHLRKTNNQTSRSFLAYLAFRSIFFPYESAAGGLISLFSHKVHSFFGKL